MGLIREDNGNVMIIWDFESVREACGNYDITEEDCFQIIEDIYNSDEFSDAVWSGSRSGARRLNYPIDVAFE